MKTKNDRKLLYIRILWIAVVLVSIKTVFTDFGADNAYSMAMSYRHIRGDLMFLEMWEPHQTSMFVSDIFMWLYGLIVPSFIGVAVYLQVCGTLLFAFIAVFLFKEVKALSGDVAAHFATIFFLIFRAKQTVFPEYSNLQIGFSALMFLTLLSFLKDQKKTSKLVLSSLFLCLEVLSYPSCAIALVAAIIIICLYSERKVFNSLVFVLTAAVTGIVYVLFFALRIGVGRFMECIKGIVDSDIHTRVVQVGGEDYYRELLLSFVWIAVSAALTFAVWLIVKLCTGKIINKFGAFGIIFFAGNAIMLLLQKKTGISWIFFFYVVPLVLMAMGFANFKNLSDGQRRFFVSGVLISVASFTAATMISNLGLITFLPYLALGGAVSFAAIKDIEKTFLTGTAFILATVLFSRGFVVFGYANKGRVMNIFEIERYVKGGANFGILTDYMTSREMEVNMAEFPQFIYEDDKLLLLTDPWLMDPAVFMATTAEISNPSVIDTPFYNEQMEEYFRINPDKMPTVVAVQCWFGQMYLGDDTYIMQWVNRYYEPVGDGSYYRFYRLSDSAR